VKTEESSKGNIQAVRDAANEVLLDNPEGLRYSDLVELIKRKVSRVPKNTIAGVTVGIDKGDSPIAFKPSRGLYRHITFQDHDQSPIPTSCESKTDVGIGLFKKKSTTEEHFYDPFAKWLTEDMEECTRAISLGGAIGKKRRWSTPDVVGIYEPDVSDIIKFEREIITAEIKLQDDPITAFGQAVAYKLFSNRVFLVLPKTTSNYDLDRIDNLCQQFGIGLIIFDSEKPRKPNFSYRVRPVTTFPDPFYMNAFLKELQKSSPSKFKGLFN